MGVIKKLDAHLIELIAAGEVVERPASIVKEFMENSIDASSTSITVEIKNGGATFIRITDNGCGIMPEDVRSAFISHATSKISAQEDLESIMTMGFRGEALASVAAVSKVEMLTRTKNSVSGTRYAIYGSKEEAYEEAGCPEGTTIIVRDLFYNTPARMKFLKKDSSEGNYVESAVEKIALAHPDVKIKFIRDGEIKLLTSGNGSLRDTIYEIYGKEAAENMIEASYKEGAVEVRGYVSKPGYARANRTYQNFYINKRFFRSKVCVAALEEGYKGAIMVGKFPACVLNISIDPRAVDVNVHPAKTEVRFQDEKAIFHTIYYAVKSALAQRDNNALSSAGSTKPTLTTFEIHAEPAVERRSLESVVYENSAEVKKEEALPRVTFEYKAEEIKTSKWLRDAVITADASEDEQFTRSVLKEPVIAEKQELPEIREFFADEIKSDEAPVKMQERKNIRIIGEVFETYIIAEYDERVLLIDKHAAHERIIYEKIVKEGAGQERQMLIVPMSVALSKNDYDAIVDNLDIAENIGFEMDDFGNGTVLVRSIPMWAEGCDTRALTEEIAANIASCKKNAAPEELDALYHSVACRSAIKAHDKSDINQMKALIEDMVERGDIKYCPHGRPTVVELTKRQLEKMFGRI